MEQRRIAALISILAVCITASATAQPAAGPPNDPGKRYATVYYKSGDLRIEAYFYRPAGAGPFPVVVYSHGSRRGHEHQEMPFVDVASMLASHGYAVLVPERRGYGKSDGPTFSQEVGGDTGDKLIRRFHEEASDVIAGADYVRTLPGLDARQITAMGWSHGGIVSLVAASESTAFVALIDQAGGSLSWNRAAALREFLKTTAGKIKVPSMCAVAKNDATTDAVTTVCAVIHAAGTPERTVIYPPFTPRAGTERAAPGHLIFSAQGMPNWQDDVLAFLKSKR